MKLRSQRPRTLSPCCSTRLRNNGFVLERRTMSHIVSIETKVHDPAAVGAACHRLSLSAPVQGTVELYSGEATGLIVKLPGWDYPIVIDTLSGTIKYDNYSGAWGDEAHLNHFLQAYA